MESSTEKETNNVHINDKCNEKIKINQDDESVLQFCITLIEHQLS